MKKQKTYWVRGTLAILRDNIKAHGRSIVVLLITLAIGMEIGWLICSAWWTKMLNM